MQCKLFLYQLRLNFQVALVDQSFPGSHSILLLRSISFQVYKNIGIHFIIKDLIRQFVYISKSLPIILARATTQVEITSISFFNFVLRLLSLIPRLPLVTLDTVKKTNGGRGLCVKFFTILAGKCTGDLSLPLIEFKCTDNKIKFKTHPSYFVR